MKAGLRRQRTSNQGSRPGSTELPPRSNITRVPSSKLDDVAPPMRQQSGASGPAGNTGVNVKVILRCRPLAAFEHRPGGEQIIECREETREVVVRHSKRSEVFDKTFSFDGVCGPEIGQAKLFRNYIVPLVDEVLQGFNCTIFAYGQTGTGKTYTMEGDWTRDMTSEPATPSNSELTLMEDGTANRKGRGELVFRLPPGVGVIPRSIALIFERLAVSGLEFSIKVSHLEIYNEELNDLLQEGEKPTLRIYDRDQAERLGVATKGLAVDKLEEIPVRTLPEVYGILSTAVRKRRTAETLLNRQSSRSHSIFTVTITMKEVNLEGEDIIRIGKLNLVDLAGSENIQRSGTSHIKDRTKEAGMINQSLLTLGRVINSLVEHSAYVPYRDSKLTRLLQDSLGGRTKTCIIATVSPSAFAYDETLSTLDYAHRAKHIRNRPEVNQRMTQKYVMKELTAEMDRLKQELAWAREKSGAVYLSNERFEEIQRQSEAQNRVAADQRDLICALQDETRGLHDSNELLERRLSDLTDESNALRVEKTRLQSEVTRLKDLLSVSMNAACETSFLMGAKIVEGHDLISIASRQKEALTVFTDALAALVTFNEKSQSAHLDAVSPSLHWLKECRSILTDQWKNQLDALIAGAKTVASEHELSMLTFSSSVQDQCEKLEAVIAPLAGGHALEAAHDGLSEAGQIDLEQMSSAFKEFWKAEDGKRSAFARDTLNPLLVKDLTSVRNALKLASRSWADLSATTATSMDDALSRMCSQLSQTWDLCQQTQSDFEARLHAVMTERAAQNRLHMSTWVADQEDLRQKDGAFIAEARGITESFSRQMLQALSEHASTQDEKWKKVEVGQMTLERAHGEMMTEVGDECTRAAAAVRANKESWNSCSDAAKEALQATIARLASGTAATIKNVDQQRSLIGQAQTKIREDFDKSQRAEVEHSTALYDAYHASRRGLQEKIDDVLLKTGVSVREATGAIQTLVGGMTGAVCARLEAETRHNDCTTIIALIDEYAKTHLIDTQEMSVVMDDIVLRLKYSCDQSDSETVIAAFRKLRSELLEVCGSMPEAIRPLDLNALRQKLDAMQVVSSFLENGKLIGFDKLIEELSLEKQYPASLSSKDAELMRRLLTITRNATSLPSAPSSACLSLNSQSGTPRIDSFDGECRIPFIKKLNLAKIPPTALLTAETDSLTIEKVKSAAYAVVENVMTARSSEIAGSTREEARSQCRALLMAHKAMQQLREVSTMSEGSSSEFVSMTENDEPRN